MSSEQSSHDADRSHEVSTGGESSSPVPDGTGVVKTQLPAGKVRIKSSDSEKMSLGIVTVFNSVGGS